VIKRHVSAEEIARFGEGDASARKAARISSHLASCHQCAKVRDDLAMVPALLAGTTTPPMPDHLAARIQTALMTESARRASPDAGSRGDTRPARQAAAWSWSRIPGLSGRPASWVTAAAAAIVIAGGGSYLIASGNGSGSNSTSGSNSAAGSRSSSGSAASAPRTAAGANVPAAPVKRGLGPELEYQRAGQPAQFTPIVTGTNYVPSQLTSQVQGTLTEYRKAVATSSPAGKVVPHATPGLSATQNGATSQIGSFAPSALEGCATRISAGARVVLVDVASYQGSPAAVIVTEMAGGPEQVSVVGTGCSASSSDVLTRTTLPAGS
jgi:hypothetical protein